MDLLFLFRKTKQTKIILNYKTKKKPQNFKQTKKIDLHLILENQHIL